MNRFFILAVLVAVAGCGKKETTPASSGGEASAASSGSGANVPKDANSKSFANALTSNAVHNFTPLNNGELRFEYITLTFKADNTWLALARMGEGEDSVDCKESGTWTMDAAETASSAAMEWKILHSDCPGRPNEGILRTKVAIDGGRYNIQIR